jgi:secreted trypsin-like serine protease
VSRRSLLGHFELGCLFILLLASALWAQQPANGQGSKPLRDLLDRPPKARIIGGHNSDFLMNSWQVALLAANRPDNRDAQFCGGSVVAPRWVLTAAHCVDQGTSSDQVAVLTGTASLLVGGERRQVLHNGILVHEKWNLVPHDSDIALIHVASDLLGDSIHGLAAGEQEPSVGQLVRVTGWGALAWHQTATVLTLQEIDDLPYVSPVTCNLPVSYDGKITANMICAGFENGRADACTGDSGGPATAVIAANRRIIGIVSWAIGCGFPKYYSVYTRLSQFRDWIKQKTNGEVT